MQSLKDLLIEELKDIYSAEKQIVKALPKMIKGVDSEELRTALSGHLEVTKEQVVRLEEVFAHLEQKPKPKTCKGMEGLLAEGAEGLEEGNPGPLRDLMIVGDAQRVEHYEMAAYGTARAIAEHLEMAQVVELLTETFDEEQEADEKLTEVAESLYQAAARNGGMRMEDEESEFKTASSGMGGSKSKAATATSRHA